MNQLLDLAHEPAMWLGFAAGFVAGAGFLITLCALAMNNDEPRGYPAGGGDRPTLRPVRRRVPYSSQFITCRCGATDSDDCLCVQDALAKRKGAHARIELAETRLRAESRKVSAAAPGDEAIFDARRPLPHVSICGYEGPWPPRAGSFMPVGFPAALLAAARMLDESAQQAAGAEDLQTAGGAGVYPAGVCQQTPELFTPGLAPDRDGLTRPQPRRNGNRSHGIADDRASGAPRCKSSGPEPTRRQSHAIDGDLDEAEIRHSNPESPTRIPGDAVSVLGSNAADSSGMSHRFDHPHRDNSKPNSVAVERPCHVENTQNGANRGCGNGDVISPVHQSSPPQEAEGYEAASPMGARR